MIGRGVLAARGILNDFNPDVLFFTGGYVAVPMAFAGRSFPSLLYVPDIEPGMALKSLAGSADVIAVTTEQSQQFFNKQVYETGYPLRPDLSLWDRQTAHQHLGVSGKLPILLVLGGSKGAHSINVVVLNNLPALLEKFEIIHLSGETDWQIVKSAREQLPVDIADRYHALSYLHEIFHGIDPHLLSALPAWHPPLLKFLDRRIGGRSYSFKVTLTAVPFPPQAQRCLAQPF